MQHDDDKQSAAAGGDSPQPDNGYAPLPGFSLADGLRWAVKHFAARPLPMLVPGILILVISGLVSTISGRLTPSHTQILLGPLHASTQGGFDLSFTFAPPPADARTIIVFVIAYLVTLTSTLMLQNATLSGSVMVAEGKPATVRRFLVPRNWNVMVNVTTVFCIALILGLILFIVPGLIVLYFLQFAIVSSLADARPTVRGSLRTSIRMVRACPFVSLVTIIAVVGMLFVGYAAFYVGIVITGPIAALLLVYTYFSIARREIVGIAPPFAPPASEGTAETPSVPK